MAADKACAAGDENRSIFDFYWILGHQFMFSAVLEDIAYRLHRIRELIS
jgi:hypothetical protein